MRIARTRRWPRAVALALLGLLAPSCSCEPGGALVVVAVRTDFVPGTEFAAVRTTLARAGETPLATHERPAFRGDDYFSPSRVAEADVPGFGTYRIVVQLVDAAGTEIAQRPVVVPVASAAVAVTVVIARGCRAACGDDLACFADRCVDARCTVETPEHCGAADCASDGECTSAAECAPARCVAGACLLEPIDARCGAGMACHPERGCEPVADRDAGGCGRAGEPCCGAACEAGTICAAGLRCEAGTCACPGGSAEADCGNGADDDCDGAADCDDADCDAAACNPHGSVCTAGRCTCPRGTTEGTGARCWDGIDGDCDGRTDCADPECTGARTPTAAAAGPRVPEGILCNATGALARGGSAAGLAQDNACTIETMALDGRNITVCVRIDFGAVRDTGVVRVRARGTGTACGDTCLGARCGTGRNFFTYTSNTTSGWTYVANTVIDGTYRDYDVTVNRQLRYALVCRQGWGCDRDNLEIDYVEARTCP